MKKIVGLLTLVLVMLSLTSCGGGGSNAKRNHLQFYVWGDSTEVACYEEIAKAYEKKRGFKVEVIAATGEYYDNLNILLSSKNKAPDIFFTEPGEFVSHLASKKIMNLQPYIDEGKYISVKKTPDAKGNIELWSVNDAYRYDGNNIGTGDYYALIKDWSPDFVLWYNKSHIDEYNMEKGYNPGDAGFMEYPSSTVPMSWDEFLDMSHKLRKDNRYGTKLDRVPYKHLMEWIQMTGSSTWDSDNRQFNYQDAGVKKAFEFFTNLQVGNKASAPIIGSGTGSGEDFANGDLSFAFFGNWAYSTYKWDNVGFEIGYAPSPVPAKADGSALTEDDVYAGSCGMIALSVYKDTSNPERAVDFLNYYMTYGNLFMANKGFNIPGNKVVANSTSFTENDDETLAEINRYFLNIAEKYTHPIVYNKYIPQITFEYIADKYVSTYLRNPSGESLDKVLEKIANDVKKEL